MMQKNPSEKTNRIRETLDKLYDQQTPLFREQIKRLQEDPSSRVFAPLAESYRRLGRIDEAIEICQRGLEHHPDFHSGRVALARCFLEKHRYQDAQFECEKVVQLAPENILAQKILGDALLAQGQTHSALHAFKMALLLAPCDISLSEKVHQLERANHTSYASPLSPPSPEPISVQPLPQVVFSSQPTQPETQPIGEKTEISSPSSLEQTEADEFEMFFNETEGEDIASMKDEQTGLEMDSFESQDFIESSDSETSAQVDAVLGFEDQSEEMFSVSSLSQVFKNDETRDPSEITTETLGDLYFKQGQFLHALKIFEKIYRHKETPALEQKIRACRVRLGVDAQSVIRQKKIALLKTILQRLHQP